MLAIPNYIHTYTQDYIQKVRKTQYDIFFPIARYLFLNAENLREDKKRKKTAIKK